MKKTLKRLRKMRALAHELSELRGHHRQGGYRQYGYPGSRWEDDYRERSYREPYWRSGYRHHRYARGRIGLKGLLAAYIARKLFSR